MQRSPEKSLYEIREERERQGSQRMTGKRKLPIPAVMTLDASFFTSLLFRFMLLQTLRQNVQNLSANKEGNYKSSRSVLQDRFNLR